jgi:hypothetical protein
MEKGMDPRAVEESGCSKEGLAWNPWGVAAKGSSLEKSCRDVGSGEDTGDRDQARGGKEDEASSESPHTEKTSYVTRFLGNQDVGCHLSGTREGFQLGPGCSPRPHHMLPWIWRGRGLVD